MIDYLQLPSHDEMNKIALKRAEKVFKKFTLNKSQCDFLKSSFGIINEILSNPNDREVITKELYQGGSEHIARVLDHYRSRLNESVDNTSAVILYIRWHHLTHCDILEEMLARSENLLQGEVIHQPIHTLLQELSLAHHAVSYYQPSWLPQFDDQIFWNCLSTSVSSPS